VPDKAAHKAAMMEAVKAYVDEEAENRGFGDNALTKLGIAEIKAGKIEYRLDKANIIHCPIAKASFDTEKIQENFQALLDAVIKAKPAAVKGTFLKSVVISSTMGPGVKLNAQKIVNG
ncbi:MAG: hypothetical protein IKH67_02115, partial [Lachnospiraceae bacterium]|nr:hypothetical protein [Lachnospiraceae bacterium]